MSGDNHDSDWGLRMSNSPNVGPVESLKIAYRRLTGRDTE